MKLKVACSLLVIALSTTTNSCSNAGQISQQISAQADEFESERRLTVYNLMTGELIYELTGKISITTDTAESQLEIIRKTSDHTYEKHFIYLTPYIWYNCTDLEGVEIQ